MELKNEFEVANTRTKLAELEARYETLSTDTSENENVREVTLRSLKRYINQFKEEIARYECGVGQNVAIGRGGVRRGIQSEAALDNTRQKLLRLEERLESNRDSSRDDDLRRTERISVKRLINQFKEEIARYEAHQPTR